MNFAIVRYLIGWLMGIESLFLLLPAFTAVIYREPELPAYIATALICMVGAGILCEYKPKNTKFYAREGFVAVALCWLVLAVTGALPFVLSREIPFAVDAIFEAASGFTTTGATILGDVEALSHASMLWRCLTHWVGGMGILVFMLIVLPLAGGQTIYLMRAESPGPSVSKISPHMRDTALILYAIYFGLTVHPDHSAAVRRHADVRRHLRFRSARQAPAASATGMIPSRTTTAPTCRMSSRSL